MDDKMAKKILDELHELRISIDVIKIGQNKLDNRISKLENKVEGDIFILRRLLESYHKEINLYHNEIVNFKDGIYNRIGEVLNTRDEQSSLSNRLSEVENLIAKLKSIPTISSAIK